MEEIRLTTSEAMLYAMIPVVIGFGLGLVPLIAGILKRKYMLGIAGLLVSTVGGAILGVIISIPAMAVFTWLIVRDRFVPTETPEAEESEAEEKEAN